MQAALAYRNLPLWGDRGKLSASDPEAMPASLLARLRAIEDQLEQPEVVSGLVQTSQVGQGPFVPVFVGARVCLCARLRFCYPSSLWCTMPRSTRVKWALDGVAWAASSE